MSWVVISEGALAAALHRASTEDPDLVLIELVANCRQSSVPPEEHDA